MGFWETWVENWDGYDHQQLYDWVKTHAAGAGSVGGADDAWSRFAALMDESVEDVQRALKEAGASWEGLAAQSMQSSVAPLAQWAQDAGTAGSASGGSVQQVGEAFSYVANAMPEPVRVTAVPGTFPHLFGGQIDQDRQEREAQQAKQRAVELMQGYSRNIDSAVSGVGTFVAPQSITVRVPPQSFGGGPIRHDMDGFPGPRPAPRKSSGPDTGPPSPGPNPPQDGPPSPGPDGGPTPAPTGGGPTTTPGSAGPVEQPSGSPLPGSPSPSDGGPGSRPLRAVDPVLVDPVPGRPINSTGERPVGGRGPGAAVSDGEPGRRATGGRAGGAGMAPIGAGAGAPREEDEEHYSPDFLKDYHDEFWDDSPPLAPAVIGAADQPPAGDGR
jgi:hypothetical protein